MRFALAGPRSRDDKELVKLGPIAGPRSFHFFLEKS
jgi:hypothetical protein